VTDRLLAGITREVAAVVASVERLRDGLTRIVVEAELGGRALRSDDLAELRPLVAKVLRRHEGFAAGAGVVLAPGVLCDAARWIEWWWADRGTGLERLEVDLDTESADFYDYTTTEWYREPERSGAPWVAGPYVDYICTHQYTFTVSVPVVHEGRFVGVAGADVLAEEVERAVLPGLARLGRVAVLASGNGRVIASNTARFAPGLILERILERQPTGDRLVAVDAPEAVGLPWVLLEGALDG